MLALLNQLWRRSLLVLLLVGLTLVRVESRPCRTEFAEHVTINMALARGSLKSTIEYWPINPQVIAEELNSRDDLLKITVDVNGRWDRYEYTNEVMDSLVPLLNTQKPVYLVIIALGMTKLSQVAWVEGFGLKTMQVYEGLHINMRRLTTVLVSDLGPRGFVQQGVRPAFIARITSIDVRQCDESLALLDIEPAYVYVHQPEPCLAKEHPPDPPQPPLVNHQSYREQPPIIVRSALDPLVDIAVLLLDQWNTETTPKLPVDYSGLWLAYEKMYGVVMASYHWCWHVVTSPMFLVAVVCYQVYKNMQFFKNALTDSTWLRSWATRKYMQEPLLSPEGVRSTFMKLPLGESSPVPDHTHGLAAADRSTASLFIDALAQNLGLEAFFYQRSRSDERRGRLGSRVYYWIKDLNVAVASLCDNARILMAMVDVDQYVDMPAFLCGKKHPTILYTFQPDNVSKVEKNYSYTFDVNSEVRYNVSGGGLYTHQVWNYSLDHMMVVRRLWGIPIETTAYLVDRRNTSSDHELILLTPLGSWGLFSAWLVVLFLQGRLLERLKVCVSSGFLRLRTFSDRGYSIATGRPGNYASAKIPVELDDTLATMARISKYDLSMAQATSFVDGNKVAAAVLVDYHRSNSGGDKAPVVCPVSDGVRRYQFEPDKYNPEASPSMVAFMSPFVDAAYAPDRTDSNVRRCVEGRVNEVKNRWLKPDPFLVATMHEFAKFMVPDKDCHKLDPVNEDVVRDRQHRPTQRQLLDRAEGVDAKRVVQMFMKAESYQKPADPRPISTINTTDKLEYSKFMYAFETVLKDQPWYAFGKSPLKVAERVVKVTSQAHFVVNTDFSRFDGHGSNLMRDLERIVLLRAFRTTYHSQIIELHQSQHNLKAYAGGDRLKNESGDPVKYDTAFSRASGSPETALFNSLVNGFVAFYALRQTKKDGVFVLGPQAYARLGIYGGDDGLTADVDPLIYKKAAARIGQELTVEPVQRHAPGVKFLARIYSPHVWSGDLNSCCDLRRQLSKFHVTVRLPANVTPRMKLLEKSRSLLLSDRFTPVIGDFCRRVEKIVGKIHLDPRTIAVSSWLARYPNEKQYPNEPAQWMTDYMVTEFPNIDYISYCQWLNRCKTLDDLMSPGLVEEPQEPKSKVDVVVNDVIIYGDTKYPLPLDSLPEGKHDVPKKTPQVERGIAIIRGYTNGFVRRQPETSQLRAYVPPLPEIKLSPGIRTRDRITTRNPGDGPGSPGPNRPMRWMPRGAGARPFDRAQTRGYPAVGRGNAPGHNVK